MHKFILLSISLLIACAATPQIAFAGPGPDRWAVENAAGTSKRRPVIVIKFQPLYSGRMIKHLSLTFSLERKVSRKMPRVALPEAEWAELMGALKAGASGKKSVFQKYGIFYARNTYCRTGPIKLNSKGRSYSGAALGAIVRANNGKVLGGKVPSGTSGTRIPAIQYLPQYGDTPTWEVRLFCSSPTPY